MRFFVYLICSVLLVSCQSVRTARPVKISQHEPPSKQVKADLQHPYISSYGQIAMDDHKKVDKWIVYFQTKGREYMEQYLSRSTRYIPMMKKVLREYRLPEDLVYAAMIESGFNPRARSFAGAVGYWQFIAGTARRYGLKVNSYVDERRDPVLSTRAAAEYFKDLYGIFGSWHLALASYNAGEYRVNRFVMRHYTRDFWYLSARRSFPSETRNYVPKFIAAYRIGKNPAQYGFKDIKYQAPMEYDTVAIAFPISLKRLAENLNTDYQELKNLNPRYRGEYVPAGGKQVLIRIPTGLKTKADSLLLAKCRMKQPKYRYADYYWYRVRRGDTLIKLARRHRTRTGAIRRLNRMRSNMLRAGRRIKIPHYNRKRKTKQLAYAHTVRRGESLNSIANKYQVSLNRLKQLNQLSSSLIHPGQILKLSAQKTRAASKGKFAFHTVRRGETLIGIAKEYNVPLPALMKKNGLSFQSILTVGKRLTIPR